MIHLRRFIGPALAAILVIAAVAITTISMVMVGISGSLVAKKPTVPITASPELECLGDVLGEVERLDCHDPSAKYIILGTAVRISRTGFDANWRLVCSDWPEATRAQWREYAWSEIGTVASGLGEVMCLIEIS